jgi:hypothetical protein
LSFSAAVTAAEDASSDAVVAMKLLRVIMVPAWVSHLRL